MLCNEVGVQCYKLFLASSSALFDVPAESDGEPEDNLAEGNNAESQTEAKESTKVGDEVKDCHSLGDFVLCRNMCKSAKWKERLNGAFMIFLKKC